jgi:uncharacterized protein involved in exopolysaccharide biosynthesis
VLEEQGLFFWIEILRRHFRFVLASSIAAGVGSLIVAFLLPRWYEARTTILPPHEMQQPLSARREDINSALLLKTFAPFSEGVSMSEIYMAILESDTVARQLIDRFHLQEHYRQATAVRTIQTLRRHVVVVPTLRRVIEVKVEDKDPQFAADLANAFVQQLDTVYREKRTSTGRLQREFLEGRIHQARTQLDAADSAFTATQEGGGVTSMSGGLQEAAEAAGKLMGKQLALAVQLRMLDAMGVRSSPVRSQLKVELNALEEQLGKMPFVGLELAKRLREVRMLEVLYDQLNRQLEVARIEETRDIPSVDVLDEAVPPDRHKRPRKGLGGIAGGLAGAVLALSWMALRETRG